MTNKFFFLAILLSSSFTFAGGVYVGNGGDAVYCTPPLHNGEPPFGGHYALDYMMTLNADNSDAAAPVQSWEESRDRIRGLLAKGYPSLLESFDRFLADLKNSDDWTRPRIWLPAPHGLIDIQDEEIRRKVPQNCGTSGNGISVIQTVVRNKQPNIIRYEYDSTILAKLHEQPLQFSFLMVHEWLWDHADSPQIIRWANQFLHSKKAETLSAEAFRLSLKNIGISSRSADLVSVCDRSPGVRDAILASGANVGIQKGCSAYTPEDLGRLSTLTVSADEMTNDDFTGLERLIVFTFSNSNIQSFPEELFDLNPQLQNMTLNNLPNLQEIPERLFLKNPKIETFLATNVPAFSKSLKCFAPVSSLHNLSIQGISETTLPENWLAPLPDNVQLVDIRDGNLTSLPPKFFDSVPKNLKAVYLMGHKFSPEEQSRIQKAASIKGVNVLFSFH